MPESGTCSNNGLIVRSDYSKNPVFKAFFDVIIIFVTLQSQSVRSLLQLISHQNALIEAL